MGAVRSRIDHGLSVGCHRTVPYLSGSAPGVGKTYAMLSEGRRRKQRGTDVVVGFVECHGRQRTEELIDEPRGDPPAGRSSTGDRISRRWTSTPCSTATPRWSWWTSWPTPTSPGSGRHEKRWQDVIELLERRHRRHHHRQHPAPREHRRRGRTDHRGAGPRAGARLGASARPTRSSWSTRRPSSSAAGCSTATSTRPSKVPQALTHYFRTDNLIALRELALRFLADETEEELLEHLRQPTRTSCGRRSERILVGVTTAPGTDAIVRRASRMASRIKGDLEVLHVAGRRRAGRFPDDQLITLRQVDRRRRRRVERGHEATTRPRPSSTSPGTHHVTQIVVGSSRRSRWQELIGGGSIVRKIARLAAQPGIDVHIIARREMPHRFRHTGGGGRRIVMSGRSRRCPERRWRQAFSRCRWPPWSSSVTFQMPSVLTRSGGGRPTLAPGCSWPVSRRWCTRSSACRRSSR